MKKIIDLAILLFSQGILTHRCTIVGVICSVWIYLQATPDDSLLLKMLSLDLYIFMGGFFMFYRLMFKTVTNKDGTLNLQEMFVCFLGDMLWATAVMFCMIPIVTLLGQSEGTEFYEKRVRGAVDPRTLIKNVPRP